MKQIVLRKTKDGRLTTMPRKRLGMTDLEVKALKPSEDIIARLLEKRNAGTEDCTLTSDIAHQIGMRAPDLNSFLIDQKIMERRDHCLQLTEKYADKGYTKYRSQFKYSSKGELKEVVYPVWTPKGVEFLWKVLKIKN